MSYQAIYFPQKYTFGYIWSRRKKSNWQQKYHFHEKMTHLWKIDICKFNNNNKKNHTILIFHEEVFLHLLVFICFNNLKIINTWQIQKIVYSVILGEISNKVLQSHISLRWARPKKVFCKQMLTLLNHCTTAIFSNNLIYCDLTQKSLLNSKTLRCSHFVFQVNIHKLFWTLYYD